MAGNAERTYLMIKPDGVQRGLVGQIIQRFEARGYKLVRSASANAMIAPPAARCSGTCRRLPRACQGAAGQPAQVSG